MVTISKNTSIKMNKIKEILIGTNNTGKYKEISALLPKEVKKYSLKEFKIVSPEETGKNFKENSLIKASYFSRKTNLICLADDSGLEIELLNGAPGIYSSRWSGKNKDFDIAIKKVFYEMSKIKKDWINNHNKANFVCCLTIFWPNGKSFEENSLIKASYYSKKTNLVCLSDDSGLEINLLNGKPGIFSARWGGGKNNFNLAMEKVFFEMKKKKDDWLNDNDARFICCLTIFWPNGKNYTSKGIVEGKISNKIKGNKGFGYDPIFIPNGYKKTFGEMEPNFKMSIDHRNKAFLKVKKFFD